MKAIFLKKHENLKEVSILYLHETKKNRISYSLHNNKGFDRVSVLTRKLASYVFLFISQYSAKLIPFPEWFVSAA